MVIFANGILESGDFDNCSK